MMLGHPALTNSLFDIHLKSQRSRNGQTVEISKLSKQFGQMRAVDNLDLVLHSVLFVNFIAYQSVSDISESDPFTKLLGVLKVMYQGEIFALLGHNGAGNHQNL